jgi:hypothetical protein
MILVSFAAAAANEVRLPFGSRTEDPERALARSQSYSGPLCRDHGQSVNVKPFERLVAFGAGGSRR